MHEPHPQFSHNFLQINHRNNYNINNYNSHNNYKQIINYTAPPKKFKQQSLPDRSSANRDVAGDLT